MTDRPAWLTERPIAHRGLHDGAAGIPENSRAAIAGAIDAGYGAEIDLQLSADRVAVVLHDYTLDRLTEASGPVGQRRAAELGRLRLAGTAETIPTLGDILRQVDGRIPLLIELKHQPNGAGPLEQASWSALADYRGPFAVQSFDPFSMAWFARHAPDVPRGQIATGHRSLLRGQPAWRRFLYRRLLANRFSQPDFIAYDLRDLPYWAARRARARGKPLLAWTVRTEPDHRVAAQHADNVIFENYRP